MVSVSQVPSPGSIPLAVIRLPGVPRLESVWAASTALLTVHVDRVWQDNTISLRAAQPSIAMRLGRAERAAASLALRSQSTPLSAPWMRV